MRESLLIESLKKTNRLYAVISNVNNMILHINEKNKIFEEACRIAVEEGKFEMSWVGLLEESTETIKPAFWAGNEAGYLTKIPEISVRNIPEGRGPTGSSVREGKTVVINDFANDPRVAIWHTEALKRGYASSIAIPILLNGKGIGAFTIYSSEPNFFNEVEKKQLEDVTANISFALEKIENEKLRQLAEEEVITKNNFIKTVVNALPGLVGCWTRDLHCTFANESYLEWFGKNANEMIGIHLSDLLGEELYTKCHPYVQGVLAGKSQQFERTLIKSDGSARYVFAQFVPNTEGDKVVGFYVLGSDITKVKVAEQLLSTRAQELERVHIKYVSLLENMSEGIQLIDFNYNYIFLNKAAINHGKTNKDELIGHTMMEKYPGIERTSLFGKIRESMEKRIPQTLENEFTFLDGSNEWFEIRISPVPEGVLILSLDITERKRMENELTLANIAREEEILFSASRMSALGEMASGIAHEINNPLAIIVMRVSQMIRKYQTGALDEEELETGLTKIASTAQRIGQVVKGLSSISRNAVNDPMKKIKLITVIEDTLQLSRERFKSHSIKLEVDLSDIPNVETEGRAPQIMQVLLNLLNNAFDAVLPFFEMWVAIKAIRGESGVIISVTDSGPGIPDPILAKIMQPFFTTKEAGKGTGLGLSISKGIIEEHQGQFYYKKNSAHTCFVIELPYIQKPH